MKIEPGKWYRDFSGCKVYALFRASSGNIVCACIHTADCYTHDEWAGDVWEYSEGGKAGAWTADIDRELTPTEVEAVTKGNG